MNEINDLQPTIVGRNLRRLRLKHKKRQKWIVEELRRRGINIAQSTISNIESGVTRDPRVGLIHAVAEALGEPIDEFFRTAGMPSTIDTDPEIESTWRAFLLSGLVPDITDEEIAALREAKWPLGKPTLQSWYHALQALRLSRKSE